VDLTVAVICLALNVFHESRGEPLEGQYAQAQVTMNRAGYDRKKVCKVMLAEDQFSWTTEGIWWMHDKPYLSPSHRPKNGPENNYAWSIALRVARESLVRGRVNVVGDATFYHVCSLNPEPRWVPHVEFVKVVGAHCFYRGDGKFRAENLIKVRSQPLPASPPRLLLAVFDEET
jgi:spore germination cell wall hydrolase CwlJ-like protein